LGFKSVFEKKIEFLFYFFKLIFFVFLDHFDADIKNDFSKIKKNYFDIYFLVKNTLKNNCNHTPKSTMKIKFQFRFLKFSFAS